jgi:hypothetical protein
MKLGKSFFAEIRLKTGPAFAVVFDGKPHKPFADPATQNAPGFYPGERIAGGCQRRQNEKYPYRPGNGPV